MLLEEIAPHWTDPSGVGACVGGAGESGAAGEGAQQGGKKKGVQQKGHSARKADGQQREKDREALGE